MRDDSAALPCLEIENISKTFTIHHRGKRISACAGVSFSVYPGEFVGITGRSGSGKSTILKLIYRTYLPQTGSIRYHSEIFGCVDLCRADERTVIYLRRHEIAYVSQFLHVSPRTTAREIVAKAVTELGRSREEALKTAEELLHHFELIPELWDSYPNTFSGGEKLRLNLARAMAKRPRLLLLDEPTASLDSGAKRRVRTLIESLKSEGTTMVGIFHDLEFMDGLCDREFTMHPGSFAELIYGR